MSKIKKIGPKNTKTYESARRVPRVTKEQIRAERYEALRFKNRFTTNKVGQFEFINRKHGKLTAEEAWKYNKDLIVQITQDYQKRVQGKLRGGRTQPLLTAEQIHRVFKPTFARYKNDITKFVKALGIPKAQSAAEFAYETLVETGKIEELALLANEEVDKNKIEYQRNNFYTYRSSTNNKTFLFEIIYQNDNDNSEVTIEITELP